MDSEQTSRELIDAYLQGDLSGEALVVFESQIKANPELAAFIRRQQMIREAALDKQRQSFIETLNKITKQERVPWYKRFLPQVPEIVPSIGNAYRPLGLATLFIIAGVSAWYFFIHTPSQIPSTPKSATSTIYELAIPTVPSAKLGTNKDSSSVEGGYLFKQKQFGRAIPFFENALKENPKDITVRLLLGICRKESGQEDEALRDFQQVIEAQAADSDIAWLAMAEIYRKKKDWTRLEAVLSNVDTFAYSRPESREAAKKLLEEIKTEKLK